MPVLRNIDLQINSGETLGLVGESGSGKSTLALATLGYLKRGLRVLNGSVEFAGEDLFHLSRQRLEKIRGKQVALIPQNSGQSLTPTQRIGQQLDEALLLHTELTKSDRLSQVVELLSQVRLPQPEQLVRRYPHELSGGQQQRVAIAMALAAQPDVLILDEPTTGLDVTTQAHILELLKQIAETSGTAMVYVSHDLGAIARVCDKVAVMYAGEVVAMGTSHQILLDPIHPYARGLLASIPRLDDTGLPKALDGKPPAPGETVDECAFADRCALVQSRCTESRPTLQQQASGEYVRCYFSSESKSIKLINDQSSTRERAGDNSKTALALQDISISYSKPSLINQLFGRESTTPDTVDGITFDIAKGDTLGLVGESGSGKSTILKAIAGLLAPKHGNILWESNDRLPERVESRSPQQLRRIQIIFQNPDESLNPRQTIEQIIAQPLMLYFGLNGGALKQQTEALLERVRLGAHYMDRLPSQLSGGEKQRVAIARAFAAKPDLVLCDEVTSALDVSVQAAVLDLLDDLRQQQNTTYVFVSHDLAVVRALSDRVAVLYQGRLCEIGPVSSVYNTPSHPYTEVLMGAVLEPHPDTKPELLANDVVELAPPLRGCAFQRRCPKNLGQQCNQEDPPWQADGEGHLIRCHIPLVSDSAGSMGS